MTSRETSPSPSSPRRRCARSLARRAGAAPARPGLAASRRRRDGRVCARARGARARPTRPAVVGNWLVVDAAGGLLVGVIGAVGLASVLVSPAYLAGGAAARPTRAPRARLLRRALRLLGGARRGAARRQPRRGLAARRGDDRRVGAARRLQRPAARARGGLEVPDPHLARSRRRAARDRHASPPASPAAGSARSPGARSAASPGRHDGARRVPAAARRARREDRLGAGAQLAAGRALRGAAAGLGAALRGAPAGGAARRVALRARARARRRRATAQARARRLRARPRSPSRCRSSGGRWPGSGCSPTRASSTWA